MIQRESIDRGGAVWYNHIVLRNGKGGCVMARKITSVPGMFGNTIHFDEKGRKIGESWPGSLAIRSVMTTRAGKRL